MNDLSGLSWDSKPSSQPPNKPANQGPARHTPSPGLSRQGTPGLVPAQSSGSRLSSSLGQGASKGANADSFSNLLAPRPGKPSGQSLSLEERQRQLSAQRSGIQGSSDPFASSDAHFWEGLGSGRGTPALAEKNTISASESESDLLAAFSAAAPVDKSSHFPPPRPDSARQTPPASSQSRPVGGFSSSATAPKPVQSASYDDDDPFGLNQLASRPAPVPQAAPSNDEDDILGDLGKPVEETLAARRREESARRVDTEQRASRGEEPGDKALAELVDMGFDAGKARRALAQTSSGHDMQGAISFLLNAAHEESGGGPRAGSQPPRQQQQGRASGSRRRPSGGQPEREGAPGRAGVKSPGMNEAELSQYASEIGASVWKSANTFWKAGQKRMAKAVAEFQQQESDPNNPRWMREAQLREEREQQQAREPPQRGPTQTQRNAGRTNEADLLEGGPPAARASKPNGAARETSRPDSSRSNGSRFEEREAAARASRPREPIPQRPSSRPVERLSRKAVEDETAQAYVSPARRKKAEPKPQPPPEPAETLDIFSDAPLPAPTAKSTAPAAASQPASRPRPSAGPAQPRPTAPARKTPSTSAATLASSKSRRQAGGAAFKQGDYGTAHSHYSNALSGIPKDHPILIVLYCNRSLTALKTGDTKGAVSDADAALAIIGPSNGDGEAIDLDDEGSKPMREFYGKALMRKAEALEHQEKWSDAAKTWRAAVEAGVGGPVAIQGRNRCEKAASPASAPKPAAAVKPVKKAAPAARPKPRASALAELNGNAEGEAVKRLREQNAAAAAASDEAFALTDAVDGRLASWKAGKSDNLRALLASLDTVLWPAAGWTKVGMGDLVMPNRVKIVYMKAIAKVHPDKLSQTATTEQKMISASVFATLNEAWDKFKKDNGM